MEVLDFKSAHFAQFDQFFDMVTVDDRLVMSIAAVGQSLSELSCTALDVVIDSR